MKGHNLLSNHNIPLMQSIEDCLRDSFERMKYKDIADNKSYFAMSLKQFFMSMTEEELEFMCHNYVHNWINEELKYKNKLLSKYQVESKLEYMKKGGITPRQGSSLIKMTEGSENPAPSQTEPS